MNISHNRGQRILVVDDNADDRRLQSNMLRELGYRLYIAENGLDGVEKARMVMPELILMDVCMPGCDGIAACRLLKADRQTAAIPVIFLTAAAEPSERVRGLMAGAVDYIVKPFDVDEVRLRVSIHLRAWSQSTETPPATSPKPATESSSSVDAMVLRAAQRMLHENLAEPPDLAGLARAVGTNTRRLNEAFRKCLGVTVFEYLREARMDAARKLLRETTLPVRVIANDLGYDNAANFATAFGTRFGLSPLRYRKAPSEPLQGDWPGLSGAS